MKKKEEQQKTKRNNEKPWANWKNTDETTKQRRARKNKEERSKTNHEKPSRTKNKKEKHRITLKTKQKQTKRVENSEKHRGRQKNREQPKQTMQKKRKKLKTNKEEQKQEQTKIKKSKEEQWRRSFPQQQMLWVFAQYRFRCALGEVGRFREGAGFRELVPGFDVFIFCQHLSNRLEHSSLAKRFRWCGVGCALGCLDLRARCHF